MRIRVLVVGVAAVLAAGCSSSGPGKAGGIGAPLAKSSSTVAAAAATAPLGQPITSGQLKITIGGPASVRPTGELGYATFSASMTNTGTAGDVAGPASFGMRCNGHEFNWVSSTTAAGKRIGPGETVTGTVVVEWAHSTDREDAPTYDPEIKDRPADCSGTAVVEAYFAGHGDTALAWTVPADQVTKINEDAKQAA